MHKPKAVLVFLILFFAGTAHATVWYVHPDSVQNCIQDCLNMCCTGDTVLVGPGTYYENIVWPDTQGIKLVSETGPASTVIDGDSAGRVIAIARPVDTTTQISGFTIQNGYTTNPGGGIMVFNTSPLIADNIITLNTAYSGGGIYLEDSRAVVRDNEITHNVCDDNGGGIHVHHWNKARITGNTISNNTANADGSEYGWGGGVHCGWVDTSYVAYNTITMNTAYAGGGIGCYFYSSPSFTRNTITENTAFYGAIKCGDHCSPTIRRNIIASNTGTHGCGGIHCWDGCSPLIDSCSIADNVGDGVTVGGASNLVLRHNNIYDNTNFGVNNYNSDTLDAEENWWGDPTGPGGFGPGSGEEVSDYVDFEPWLEDSVWPIGIIEYESEEATLGRLLVYPNPFSDAVSIRCEMRDAGYRIQDYLLEIYDITGRMVKSFDPLPYAHSTMQISWDGTDHANRPLPSGVYILRVKAGEHAETQKLLLIR
jgi:parallel beta-helix repeat protein